MLSFSIFELYAILSNLIMTDTIFGNVPVRDRIIAKLHEYLEDNALLPSDTVMHVDVE